MELPRLIRSRGEGQKGPHEVHLDDEAQKETDDETCGDEAPVSRPGRINLMVNGACKDESGDVGRGGPVRLGHLAHGRGEAEEGENGPRKEEQVEEGRIRFFPFDAQCFYAVPGESDK